MFRKSCKSLGKLSAPKSSDSYYVLQYIGSFPVCGFATDSSTSHEQRVIAYVTEQLKKLVGFQSGKPVLLSISTHGVKVCSLSGETTHMAYPLRLVSNATCDAPNCQFAFIARDSQQFQGERSSLRFKRGRSFVDRRLKHIAGRSSPKRSVTVEDVLYCHVFETVTSVQAEKLVSNVADIFASAAARSKEEQQRRPKRRQKSAIGRLLSSMTTTPSLIADDGHCPSTTTTTVVQVIDDTSDCLAGGNGTDDESADDYQLQTIDANPDEVEHRSSVKSVTESLGSILTSTTTTSGNSSDDEQQPSSATTADASIQEPPVQIAAPPLPPRRTTVQTVPMQTANTVVAAAPPPVPKRVPKKLEKNRRRQNKENVDVINEIATAHMKTEPVTFVVPTTPTRFRKHQNGRLTSIPTNLNTLSEEATARLEFQSAETKITEIDECDKETGAVNCDMERSKTSSKAGKLFKRFFSSTYGGKMLKDVGKSDLNASISSSCSSTSALIANSQSCQGKPLDDRRRQRPASAVFANAATAPTTNGNSLSKKKTSKSPVLSVKSLNIVSSSQRNLATAHSTQNSTGDSQGSRNRKRFPSALMMLSKSSKQLTGTPPASQRYRIASGSRRTLTAMPPRVLESSPVNSAKLPPAVPQHQSPPSYGTPPCATSSSVGMYGGLREVPTATSPFVHRLSQACCSTPSSSLTASSASTQCDAGCGARCRLMNTSMMSPAIVTVACCNEQQPFDSTTGSSGTQVECLLSLTNEDEITLKGVPWYAGGVDRDTVVAALRGQPVGSFVVRRSASQRYCLALSVRVPSSAGRSSSVTPPRSVNDSSSSNDDGQEKESVSMPPNVSHYLVLKTDKGFKLKGFSKAFGSIQSLVTHHSIMQEQLPCPLKFISWDKQPWLTGNRS